MPVTQYLWTWDHFLHGGRDFELSALMALSLFCLVLVLAKHCKQCVDSLFRECRILRRVPTAVPLTAAFSIFPAQPVIEFLSSIRSIPLQI